MMENSQYMEMYCDILPVVFVDRSNLDTGNVWDAKIVIVAPVVVHSRRLCFGGTSGAQYSHRATGSRNDAGHR